MEVEASGERAGLAKGSIGSVFTGDHAAPTIVERMTPPLPAEAYELPEALGKPLRGRRR